MKDYTLRAISLSLGFIFSQENTNFDSRNCTSSLFIFLSLTVEILEKEVSAPKSKRLEPRITLWPGWIKNYLILHNGTTPYGTPSVAFSITK
jgi:hypothetical protein